MTRDEVEIRSYRESDERGVVALWGSVFADDPPWNRPPDVIRRKLAVQAELFLVAASRGSILGTVLAGFDGFRGWVHHLAVDPAARRRGVGTRLMREAESRLRASGCPKLNLQIRAANEGAVRFYERLGFKVEDRISMARLLEPANGWRDPT